MLILLLSMEWIWMASREYLWICLLYTSPVFAPALYKSISLTSTDVNLAVEKSRASRLDMVNQVTKAFFQLLLEMCIRDRS